MSKRKAVPISTRFEVFKRDSFKCQYCGRSAPEVVLHVDHIIPVSKGGGNEITNLVTSCQDCNLGKSNRTLDDNSVVQKQRKQLEDLQERREQLEMMMQWKTELDKLDKKKVEMICQHIYSQSNFQVSTEQSVVISKAIKKYGFELVFEAADIAIGSCRDYFRVGAYITAICKNKTIEKVKPYYGKLLYIRGILCNKFPDIPKTSSTVDDLDTWIIPNDVTIDKMEQFALISGTSEEFITFLELERDKNRKSRQKGEANKK